MDAKAEALTGELAAQLEVSSLDKQPVDPRSLPWRFSTLKEVARSPAHYWWACQREQDERLCLRIGAGTHAILFDQPHKVWPDIRRGRAWEAFAEEYAAAAIMNPREYLLAKGIADSIRRHSDAVRYLLDSTTLERRIDWRYLDRDVRSTPDAFGRHHVTELKTTRCAEPVRFTRDAGFRAYHVQLATYREALVDSGLSTASEQIIVAVESAPPHPVTVLRVSEETIDRGHRTLRLWAEQVKACEEAGVYPGYVQSVVDFDLGDADDQFTLRINGEDMDVE